MKYPIFPKVFPALMMVFSVWLMSCDKQNTPEALEIQKPKTYDDQYYANLRAYKKTKHQILFVWFADYSQETSMGTRFLGLPDSIDIVSLWGGIPAKEEGKKSYDEMRFVQQVKGTKMVGVSFVHLPEKYSRDDAGIKQYGDDLLKYIETNALDGWDFDNETDAKEFLTGSKFSTLLKYMGQKIGPKSSDPEKLLIVDGGDFPWDAEPYISYLVKQSYTIRSAAQIQREVDNTYSRHMPVSKLVLTMNMGDDWKTGGAEWTDAKGESKSMEGGKMYQMEGFAAWNPTQGPKGGSGSFYVHRDYNSNPPYKYTRRAIQIQNPAVK